MASANRISRLALLALGLALGVAVFGFWLRRSGIVPFWGGLLLAFGEAAIVGGLADWFAVRALFTHPMGIPFPHSALIPRSRSRIVREIRNLVEEEWLPQSLLLSKLESFDFVEGALGPIVEPMRPYLRDLLRNVARDLLENTSPEESAKVIGDSLARSVTAESIGPFLGQLAKRAGEQGWLEPILREWVQKLRDWTLSEESQTVIRQRLDQAAEKYRGDSFLRTLTLGVAELFGGVDLDRAATVIQSELLRFAEDQLGESSPMNRIVRDGLLELERRFEHEPEFLQDLRQFLLDTSHDRSLPALVAPMLRSFRDAGLQQLDDPDEKLLDWAMRPLDTWLARVSEDADLRERINVHCRRWGKQLLEQHHSLVGNLVEEQLDRFSERRLTELIEDRVGEDLSWIRLNGTFVGGLIGIVLYLLFQLVG